MGLTTTSPLRRRAVAGVLLALATATPALAADPAPTAAAAPATLLVEERVVDDLKAVYATVRSKDRIDARVRTPGTIVSLKVKEGDHVEPGQMLALIADPKIAIRIKALDAQIVGLESRVATAKADFDRGEQLRVRGVNPQARVDQLKTAFDLASNDLKVARADRLVAEEQVTEGRVLAPAGGRVIKVPVTEGGVMMAGESLATIAANQYVLRLELPERHARFIKVGDPIRLGARGLAAGTASNSTGRITQVYPELQGGRVIADAEAKAIGDYFVGERAMAWISAGTRKTIVVPAAYVVKRYGLDYVRVALGPSAVADVVVQTGRPVADEGEASGVEILSGLAAGDRILAPAVQ